MVESAAVAPPEPLTMKAALGRLNRGAATLYMRLQHYLATRAAGLGAALITLRLWSRFLARRALGLPWNIAPCAVIPLGWPIGRYGPTTRRPVGEVVSVDRYGNRPFRQPA
jgi:hypothetical protein